MPGEGTIIKAMSLKEGNILYSSGEAPPRLGHGLARGPD